jgi:hypothetical protein
MKMKALALTLTFSSDVKIITSDKCRCNIVNETAHERTRPRAGRRTPGYRLGVRQPARGAAQ